MRCAVIGGGAWGTALAHVLATNDHAVTLWAREPEVVESIMTRHENALFLAGAKLSPTLAATTRLSDALRDADVVVYATPSSHLRSVAMNGVGLLQARAVIAVATKGIEEGTLALMTDVASSVHAGHEVVAISGPSFAAEVVENQPTAVVAASTSVAAAACVQLAFSNQTFRVYTQPDVIGVELGGALKNVMAVATGIVEGVGLGHNSRAALITRGLAEMTRLGVALGATASTFAGLAGIGDLVLTCTGSLSRNRALGEAVGRGATLSEALAGKQTVAEGVVTARSAAQLAAKLDVEMPIVEMVNRILFEGHTARLAVAEMMARELRPEQDASTTDPVQEYFSIGEVCDLTGLRPHVLRYWESQFRFLSPTKNRSGNRVYQRREVDLIMLVKHLLYTEKYTIEGARQKVDDHKKSLDLKLAARGALNIEGLEALEAELRELVDVLDESPSE